MSILNSCTSSSVKSKEICFDDPFKFKRTFNFNALDLPTLEQMSDYNIEYCCSCGDMDPICSKPTIKKRLKEVCKK